MDGALQTISSRSRCRRLEEAGNDLGDYRRRRHRCLLSNVDPRSQRAAPRGANWTSPCLWEDGASCSVFAM